MIKIVDANNQSNSPEAIDGLIDQLIIAAGLENLPEDEKQDFRDNMNVQINRRIGSIIVENLSEEGLAAYEKLLTDSLVPDPEELNQLLETYLPDYPTKIKAGLDEFLQEVAASFNK